VGLEREQLSAISAVRRDQRSKSPGCFSPIPSSLVAPEVLLRRLSWAKSWSVEIARWLAQLGRMSLSRGEIRDLNRHGDRERSTAKALTIRAVTGVDSWRGMVANE
jgi:hypothetical protein